MRLSGRKDLGEVDAERLARLRDFCFAKGFIQRVPKTQCYQATEQGYAIAILYLKIYQRLYAPLAAALLEAVPSDNQVLRTRQTKLDRLYVAVHRALTDLGEHLGIVNITDDAA